RKMTTGGEVQFDDAPGRSGFFEERRGLLYLDGGGQTKIQTPIRCIRVVDAHIANRSSAEIPKSSPFKRDVSRIVGTPGRGPEPEIPVERGGNRRSVGWSIHTLRPPVSRPIGPD